MSEFCKKDDDFWGISEDRRKFFQSTSSITGMEVFVIFRKNKSLLALALAIHTLVHLFHDWCVAKTSLRTEFFSEINRENISQITLLLSWHNAVTPRSVSIALSLELRSTSKSGSRDEVSLYMERSTCISTEEFCNSKRTKPKRRTRNFAKPIVVETTGDVASSD